MYTKIIEDGKLNLVKTIKFNLGLSTGKRFLPIRGDVMRTMPNGKVRRGYNLTNKF